MYVTGFLMDDIPILWASTGSEYPDSMGIYIYYHEVKMSWFGSLDLGGFLLELVELALDLGAWRYPLDMCDLRWVPDFKQQVVF